MKNFCLVLVLTTVCLTGLPSSWVLAAEPASRIIIYQNSQALISQERSFNINPGTSQLAWPEVTSRLDPTSVSLDFLWLNSQATEVTEQNYSFDLASRSNLLQKYLGRTVTVVKTSTGDGGKQISASQTYQLLTAEDNPVLQDKDGKIHLNVPGEIVLPALPQGLTVKPSLVFKIKNLTPGAKNIRLSYLSGSLDWSANYIANLDEASGSLSLICSASISNESGLDFYQANVGLVAGNLNQAYRSAYKNVMMAEAMPAAPSGDSSAPAFEYHLFSLPGGIDLTNNQTKQITLFARGPVPMTKIYNVAFSTYDYYRTKTKQPVTAQVKFKNSAKDNLGLVMPVGLVRFYQDIGGQKMFLGEDSLGQTPVEEEVLLNVGQAFDLTAEKEKLAQNIISDKLSEARYKISLRSQKDKKVELEVVQFLGINQQLTKSSPKPVSQENQQVKWFIPLEKKSSQELTYTIQTFSK